MRPIHILQVGIGPVGQRITRYILQRQGFRIVGAVDKDPEKTDRDLGEICALGPLSLTVSESVERIVGKTTVDVALVTTVSQIEEIANQIQEIVSLGIPVVTTCEELAYPWETAPAHARKIDETAKKHKVAVLGTGVNPGFLMDLLPICYTALCQSVEKISVSRIQDAAYRRVPFQKKIGAGLSLDEFEAKKQEGILRHVGLTESIHMIAARMGWKLDRTEDVIFPIVAEQERRINGLKIEAGRVAGVHQVGRGFVNGEEKITLLFKASVGEKNPCDKIEIQGRPPIVSIIPGGVNGDIATCAITINAVRHILNVPPGLKTMADLPVVSCFC